MKSREDLLNESIAANIDRKFDWSNFNCALSAAEIAKAYCGKDHGEKFRKLCSGPLAAARIIRKAGGLDGIMDELGFEAVPLSLAKRGDCVLKTWDHEAKQTLRKSLGIIVDGRKAIFFTRNGKAFVDVLKCDKAWKVGR